jgi:hypothetical protein
MKYIITKDQDRLLKITSYIKDIVDSFLDDDILKIDYILKYNDKYDYYIITPTFYIRNKWVHHFKTGLESHKLAQRIEDYTGLNITSTNSKVIEV